jgi:hypothetical protein
MNARSMQLSIHFVIGSLAVFLLFTESIEAEDRNVWFNFKILKHSVLDFIVRLKERSYIHWTHVRFAEWCCCSCSFTDRNDVNTVLLNFNVCCLSADFNFRTESALMNVWNTHLCRPLPSDMFYLFPTLPTYNAEAKQVCRWCACDVVRVVNCTARPLFPLEKRPHVLIG